MCQFGIPCLNFRHPIKIKKLKVYTKEMIIHDDKAAERHGVARLTLRDRVLAKVNKRGNLGQELALFPCGGGSHA